jgi:hypothetical protein
MVLSQATRTGCSPTACTPTLTTTKAISQQEIDRGYNGFLAVTAVMHAAVCGLARYDMKPGTEVLCRVVDRDGPRRPEAWERWATPLARAEYRRIAGNHRRTQESAELDLARKESVIESVI